VNGSCRRLDRPKKTKVDLPSCVPSPGQWNGVPQSVKDVGIGSCNIKNMPRRVDKGAKSTHVIFHELIAGDGITVDVLDRLDSGYAARREIRNNPERIEGQGMATAGIVLGWVGIGTLALTIIMFLYLRKIDTGHPIMRETRSTAA
jgi:Domain of unknown function (DUF4190)